MKACPHTQTLQPKTINAVAAAGCKAGSEAETLDARLDRPGRLWLSQACPPTTKSMSLKYEPASEPLHRPPPQRPCHRKRLAIPRGNGARRPDAAQRRVRTECRTSPSRAVSSTMFGVGGRGARSRQGLQTADTQILKTSMNPWSFFFIIASLASQRAAGRGFFVEEFLSRIVWRGVDARRRRGPSCFSPRRTGHTAGSKGIS